MSDIENKIISFSRDQSDYLGYVMQVFCDKAVNRGSIRKEFLLLLGSVKDIIKGGGTLEWYELEVVLWVLDQLLAELDEVDPMLESIYHKIRGWYPIEPNWTKLLYPEVNYED
jgi:hypothetical protein